MSERIVNRSDEWASERKEGGGGDGLNSLLLTLAMLGGFWVFSYVVGMWNPPDATFLQKLLGWSVSLVSLGAFKIGDLFERFTDGGDFVPMSVAVGCTAVWLAWCPAMATAYAGTFWGNLYWLMGVFSVLVGVATALFVWEVG